MTLALLLVLALVVVLLVRATPSTTVDAARSMIGLQERLASRTTRSRERVRRDAERQAARDAADRAELAALEAEAVDADVVTDPELVVVPTGTGDEAWVFGFPGRVDAFGPTLGRAPRYLEEWVGRVITAADGVPAEREVVGRRVPLDDVTSRSVHACHAAQDGAGPTVGFVLDDAGRWHAVPWRGPVRGPAATAVPNALAAVALRVELDHLDAQARASRYGGRALLDYHQGASHAERLIESLCRAALDDEMSAVESYRQIGRVIDAVDVVCGEIP